MELEVFTTNVELQDIPSYSTNITVEGQLLKLSFLWNERIGKRVLSIKNTSDVVYLQNTILHPNEPLELNSNAVLDDLPYSVTLVKTGDVNKVGNIFNWSKDFILCFSRTVDLDVKKLNVVYGVTTPSTPILPPSNGGGDNGGGDNGGGGETPTIISATYDSFYQTMTVTGQSGLLVETSDGNGVVIGGGVIGSDGSVTYPINEDNHDRSVPIFTKSITSNVVEHKLTVSYFAECYIDEYTRRFNPPMGFFAKSIAQRGSNAWDNVQFDENATGRIYLEWTWGEQKEIRILTMDDLRAAFTVRYGSDFYPSNAIWNLNLNTSQPSLKVRFDVDTPIVFGMTYANLVHHFYDDGSDKQTIGYRFATDFTENYCIRKVPAYLPKSVKIMDFMFASGGNRIFETVEATDNLALWDVGHVVSMNSTFAETDDPVIPISLWRPVKLTSMARFMSATACTGLGVSSVSDWKTPLLTNINEAFIGRYTGQKYYSDLSRWCVPLITVEPELWHSGQMTPPVWGTCPA